jgi:CAAX prenyl protease-like protein
MRAFVAEMRWAFSWEAVVVGVAVFVMWVGIDPYYPHMKSDGELWNPQKQFGEGSALAWMFIVVRTLGMTLVVPPLEEVFWRSFLYRFIIRFDFLTVPFKRLDGIALAITAALFGVEHFQWLAGILCGLAYQWLVLRKDRIGDAMTAHAITNFMLAVWVVWRGDWKFF